MLRGARAVRGARAQRGRASGLPQIARQYAELADARAEDALRTAILRLAEGLRDTSGRKMTRFDKPVISARPSVQGPDLGGRRLEVRLKES